MSKNKWRLKPGEKVHLDTVHPQNFAVDDYVHLKWSGTILRLEEDKVIIKAGEYDIVRIPLTSIAAVIRYSEAEQRKEVK